MDQFNAPPPGLPSDRVPTGTTIDYRLGDTPSPQRLQTTVAAVGASPAPGVEVVALLRKRLRFLALVFAALFLVFAIDSLYSVLARPQPRSVARWVLHVTMWLGLPLSVGLAALLSSARPLSLSALRRIEVTLIGIVFFGMAWYDFLMMFFYANWNALHLRPEASIAQSARGICLPWYALMVGYGTLVPNTTRRGALMVSGMALTPVALSLGAGLYQDALTARFIGIFFVQVVVWMALGGALAAYGAHRIETLRRQAAARQLGPYQLKRRLGVGGMGEVYLAEHVLLKQPCAVKLIRPDRAGDARQVARFEREVRAMAHLKHWNTVQVYDYGRADDGTFYYAMEYLRGVSLRDLVERHGPLAPARVVHLLRQVCASLRKAHAAGLVHRDVKPGNIMVCEVGGIADVAKLLDFGLVQARASDDGERLTVEGTVAGTPAFMSPEQAGGEDDLDARSDIYSVGAVAFFLLIGRPPFVSDKAIQIVLAHIHEAPPALTRLRPDVPVDLEAVVLRCLEKKPEGRFAGAGAVEEALAGCACAGEWSARQAAEWWRERGAVTANEQGGE
jgi:tRNA A-37 threonylcarbamoyl transferase component Bud32